MKTGKMTFNLATDPFVCTLDNKENFENHFDCEVTPSRTYFGTYRITATEPRFADLVGLDVQDVDNDGNNFILKPFKVSDYIIQVEIRDVTGLVTDLCNKWDITISTGIITHNMPFNFIGDQTLHYISPTYLYFNGVKEAGEGDITIEKSVDSGVNWDNVNLSNPFFVNVDDILRFTCVNKGNYKTITLY